MARNKVIGLTDDLPLSYGRGLSARFNINQQWAGHSDPVCDNLFKHKFIYEFKTFVSYMVRPLLLIVSVFIWSLLYYAI